MHSPGCLGSLRQKHERLDSPVSAYGAALYDANGVRVMPAWLTGRIHWPQSPVPAPSRQRRRRATNPPTGPPARQADEGNPERQAQRPRKLLSVVPEPLADLWAGFPLESACVVLDTVLAGDLGRPVCSGAAVGSRAPSAREGVASHGGTGGQDQEGYGCEGRDEDEDGTENHVPAFRRNSDCCL